MSGSETSSVANGPVRIVVPVVSRHGARDQTGRASWLVAPALALGLFAATPIDAAPQGRVTLFRDSIAMSPRGPAQVPFGPGEELRYRVKYGVFGVGEARMSIAGVDTLHGNPVYAAALHIRASPLGYDIDHTLSSWIDTRRLVTRRFVNDQRGRDRYRAYDIFPEDRRVARLDHDTTWAISTTEPLDDIAFVFFARTLPLEVGRTYVYHRYFKEERNPIILKVVRKDTREVGAGVFSTIVVQPLIPGSSFFSEGGDAEIHFSDDERRLLVYMKVDGPILPFNITMHLREIQRGLPLEARAASGEEPDGGKTSESARTGEFPLLRLRRRGFRFWGAQLLAVGFFWLARPSGASLLAGGTLILAGLAIRGWAAGILEKDRELTVSGPYAFSRNPLYLGSFLIGVGAVVAGRRVWVGPVFLVFFVWAYAGKMARERDALETRFGQAYRDYRHAVPLFLPRLTPYRASRETGRGATRFSVARYIRNREWEAALGAVAATGFLAFKAMGWALR